jgi:hypothetical protein
MFLVMSDDDRRIITEHGRNNIYQTFFPNGGVAYQTASSQPNRGNMAGDADTVGLKIVRGALAGVFFLLYDLREYST